MLSKITGTIKLFDTCTHIYHVTIFRTYREPNPLARPCCKGVFASSYVLHLILHKCEQLAGKLLEMGRSLLRNNSREGKDMSDVAADAVRWLQKAFAITEKLDDSLAPGFTELKVRHACLVAPVCLSAVRIQS
jgi:hypothetical protein